MNEDLEVEIYLIISPKAFRIFLFDKKKLENLYKEEVFFKNKEDQIDFNFLDKFLEENVFKIEKLMKSFLKNIYLIIDCKKIFELNFAIKKKNYKTVINQNLLESILTDAKDLFKENYPEKRIMHMLIKNYIVDGKNYLSLDEDFNGDNCCLEIQFKSISKYYASNVDKILEKYQIRISEYFDLKYIEELSVIHNIDLIEMIFRVKNGFNQNEVKLIPKIYKKTGFFEKFFQLFS